MVALFSVGCAYASLERGTAIAFGPAMAHAGDCSVDEAEEVTPVGDAAAERLAATSKGSDCALAHGGRGSPGLYATIAASVAAAVSLLMLIF